MESNVAEPVDVEVFEDGSDGGASPTAPILEIPQHGSGERIGFLLGMPLSWSSGAGRSTSLPPVAAGASAGGRKRARVPTDGGRKRVRKGKDLAGVARTERTPSASPCETRASCSSQAPAESVNEISDDEEEEEEQVKEMPAAATRRLTSAVWQHMVKKMVRGKPTVICNYCHAELTATANAGTSHLRDHLKSCTLRKIKMKSSGKKFSQSQLRMTAQAEGKVTVESYVFHQETCREELCNMIVLHDYPLSIVDHAGFRRFVHAL